MQSYALLEDKIKEVRKMVTEIFMAIPENIGKQYGMEPG